MIFIVSEPGDDIFIVKCLLTLLPLKNQLDFRLKTETG